MTNGEVLSPRPEDGSRVFIGGTSPEVNGVARQNLAALDAVTGALITDCRPTPPAPSRR